ncbi:TetR family transcriptional regulator [Primorskyibacter flagellatus]|uniref:TetR family transcriptional regulator n=1 Tax=Primorskyibacter flagellatus TaxID=1387277 RepID=A0A917ADW2_9RHOB|nr:TetR/AcrR family transcriptional regulator [Primorskyibacter flagellatus]GGE44591.1 TetR family transcriptional regulator [Primorskyibacter flagellatus]
MTATRSYHHGNLKPALIAAGLEILESEGLDRLSLRACAERVGVSHTAPKNHFGNVTGLLTAIAAEGQTCLHAAMTDGLNPDAPRAERRRAAAEGYVAFARAHPALFELMWARGRVDFSDPVLAAAMSASFAVLRDVAGASGDPAAASVRDWCTVHGFALLSLQGVFDKDGMRHLGVQDILPDPPSGA